LTNLFSALAKKFLRQIILSAHRDFDSCAGSFSMPKDKENEFEESETDGKEDGESEEQNEDDSGIPLSDVEYDAEDGDVDLVPYQKLHKDNHAALTQALSTIALPHPTLPFHVHQSITSTEHTTVDVNDDLSRELAFYKQALEAAQEGRKRLLEEGKPFSRPSDYFAEMLKDDEHMDKVYMFVVSLIDRLEIGLLQMKL
jgi:rRNA-processing protein EBP2